MGSKDTEVKIKIKKPKITGGSKKGRQHDHNKGKYLKQQDRTAKNKARAWKRHLVKHPNDKVAAANIKRLTD